MIRQDAVITATAFHDALAFTVDKPLPVEPLFGHHITDKSIQLL